MLAIANLWAVHDGGDLMPPCLLAQGLGPRGHVFCVAPKFFDNKAVEACLIGNPEGLLATRASESRVVMKIWLRFAKQFNWLRSHTEVGVR